MAWDESIHAVFKAFAQVYENSGTVQAWHIQHVFVYVPYTHFTGKLCWWSGYLETWNSCNSMLYSSFWLRVLAPVFSPHSQLHCPRPPPPPAQDMHIIFCLSSLCDYSVNISITRCVLYCYVLCMPVEWKMNCSCTQVYWTMKFSWIYEQSNFCFILFYFINLLNFYFCLVLSIHQVFILVNSYLSTLLRTSFSSFLFVY